MIKVSKSNSKIYKLINSEVKEPFCFLACSHILQGFDQYADRKNLAVTIKTFLETFKNKQNAPALILKSSLAGFSITEEQDILDKIDRIRKTVNGHTLPSIYLLHGSLEDVELNALYNHEKVKVMLALGNEGFGRPALEFTASTGKPIVTSPWSGQVDFLDKNLTLSVGGTLESVHPAAVNNYLIKESVMYKPDPVQLSIAMKDVYENYKNYTDNGKKQGYRSRTQYSMEKMTEKLSEIINKNMPVISKPMTITLPKLKKPIEELLPI